MSRAISLDCVTKVYERGIRAVDRFSLDIEPGEFVVLLGPSGCGKSTVLRMIAGLESVTEGQLLLDGEDAAELAPGQRGMAMVFQNFALYPRMTNRDNIGFPLKLEARGDVGPRVDATARLLGIEDLLDRYPAQLSGGERQRVAIGRAISREPTAFLMDEPLSNIDAKLRNHLRAEVARLNRELAVTTVYVTHDQAEAMSLGDRIAVMRDGVLQQVGSPREAYALPKNIFVAAFIGTPRINLLEAVVHAPLPGRMTIDLGRQSLVPPEPLSPDHQMLRIQQGRPVIVGLRSEAVRIARPSLARAGECAMSGIVEHVEYLGHEALLHLNTGSRAALVPALEGPRTDTAPGGHRKNKEGTVLGRLRDRAVAHLHGLGQDDRGEGAVGVLEEPPVPAAPPQSAERAAIAGGDLVVRTGPDVQVRPGTHVPLLIDLEHLYVFDQQGRRVCPAPAHQPRLDE
ncbi:ABC transporter ATP-binding protein [Streptomyces sp. NBC_01808]|uniref:ABC transporter ATP-binding protein n=1 Tax=Streptomyces sp. NBC_01808 TaxID=2975947 RepID=UPI002DDC788F|nr:ABC transporter ATP-binding protein [Streptomyces sp. NBC_01808]WSA42208.1 ABC transporter ATP-binding protein [Streptomyces sp. NBC_01808]